MVSGEAIHVPKTVETFGWSGLRPDPRSQRSPRPTAGGEGLLPLPKNPNPALRLCHHLMKTPVGHALVIRVDKFTESRQRITLSKNNSGDTTSTTTRFKTTVS